MKYIRDITEFTPDNEQERSDRAIMLHAAARDPEALLTRESALAHMTASSMIFSPDGERVLMVYHNIYKSWSWTGGHADGDEDLQAVALREAKEETGVTGLTLLSPGIHSLEIIPVPHHIKRGKYVSDHLHLNATYAMIGDDTETLFVKPDENSGVQWIPILKLGEYVSEAAMLPIYAKIIERAKQNLFPHS